jgi:hypothetical protein
MERGIGNSTHRTTSITQIACLPNGLFKYLRIKLNGCLIRLSFRVSIASQHIRADVHYARRLHIETGPSSHALAPFSPLALHSFDTHVFFVAYVPFATIPS